MRAALYQGPGTPGDVSANVAAIAAAAARAAAAGADILITPEMSATGYNIGELSAQRAEPAHGALFDAVARIAVSHGIAVVYGYPEAVAAGNYNTVQVVGPRGEDLGSHRKTHLYGDLDRGLFIEGHTLVSQFELCGLTVGLAICYDIEFPEVARAHALAGTDVLLVPTGLMAPFEVVSKILVPARAYENQLYVAYVNRCDVEAELQYCGLTCAISPDGADVARAGGAEELLVVDFDPAALATGRAINTHLPDRRNDLYSTVSQENSRSSR
ncbi:carbon-nitrogen hydrolase family protein [Antrihabitans sp. YC2-6]|uniref:carbon-nitrogen hydrolase family protein n=1 Tax=Antrihabitans sp. YC2-6 TaxID=2799498 RepID=UPI0018F45134|nr:carbon-nitrogen hydrolase family protein [Antrihabitans sp. YC2-6]MBJ8346669.1 carbon-nitrogen hydrolase family protein [Antrihabitans sp. YC2-6]